MSEIHLIKNPYRNLEIEMELIVNSYQLWIQVVFSSILMVDCVEYPRSR